jgi:hypothetical protein
MHASDIKAFKKFWFEMSPSTLCYSSEKIVSRYPNCVEYMGGSHPREGFPYTVLKGGITSLRSHALSYRFYMFTISDINSCQCLHRAEAPGR